MNPLPFWPSHIGDHNYSLFVDETGRPSIQAKPITPHQAEVVWEQHSSLDELIPYDIRARNDTPPLKKSLELSYHHLKIRLHHVGPQTYTMEILEQGTWHSLCADIYLIDISCTNSGTHSYYKTCLASSSFLSKLLNLDKTDNLIFYQSIDQTAVIIGLCEKLSGEVYNSIFHFDTYEMIMVFPKTKTIRCFRYSYRDTST